MSTELLFTIAGVGTVLVLALGAIALFPRRTIERVLICRAKNTLARVVFLRKETRWGDVEPVDVRECSLFPGGPVDCDKSCMRAARSW